jgi:inner membrane protein
MAAIVVIIVLLMLPLLLVELKRDERADRQQSAVIEMTAAWGDSQRVVGPRLCLPFDFLKDVKGRDYAALLPSELFIDGRLEPKLLHRGIYKAQVYQAHLTLRGHFELPPGAVFAEGHAGGREVELQLGLGHHAGVNLVGPLTWAGEEIPHSRMTKTASGGDGFVYTVVLEKGRRTYDFELNLGLRGSDDLALMPLTRQGRVTLESPATAPSFRGARLPDTRTVSAEGFAAEWNIAALDHALPSVWLLRGQAEMIPEVVEQGYFGVRLLPGITDYRSVERAINYGALFLITIFAGLFLGEFLGGRPLHLLNYILVGAALCLFFLALLALAEITGFGLAYGLATLASVGLIMSYARAVLREPRAVGSLAVLLGGIFGYLYMVLRLEDFSLIAGTVLLFVLLGAVMFVTRHLRPEDI